MVPDRERRGAGKGWAVLILTALTAVAAEHKSPPPVVPDVPLSLRIPVAPLGYLPPGQNALTFRVPSSTLNFVDDTHLLFTFHKGSLLKRMPDEPGDDQDQVIHAMVLDLAPGKDRVQERISSEADWRMHDRNRYLWQLPHGRFLVRSRNTLYEIDRGLHFTPYLRTDSDITEIDLSADGGLISIQSEIKGERVPPADSRALGEGARHQVRMNVINTEDDKVKYTATNPVTVHLHLIHSIKAEGYVSAEPAQTAAQTAAQRSAWSLFFYPFKGEKQKFADVLSSCQPEAVPLNSEAVLVTSCTRDSDDHLEQVFSLDGRTLWQQRWSGRYIWPELVFAEDGTRFAFASIELSHSIGVLDPVDETMMTRQLVGIYDTATGKLRLVRTATPMLTAGGNCALSPNGQKVAILREGAIEVYELPPAPVD